MFKKKKADTALVKTAERVGRTLGRGARGVDTVTKAAKKLAPSAKQQKAAKKAVTKAVTRVVKTAKKLAKQVRKRR